MSSQEQLSELSDTVATATNSINSARSPRRAPSSNPVSEMRVSKSENSLSSMTVKKERKSKVRQITSWDNFELESNSSQLFSLRRSRLPALMESPATIYSGQVVVRKMIGNTVPAITLVDCYVIIHSESQSYDWKRSQSSHSTNHIRSLLGDHGDGCHRQRAVEKAHCSKG